MILPQAQQDLELFELLAQLQQHRHPVAQRVGAHHQFERAPRPIAQICAQGVLVITREAVHHLLQVQAQVVARLVDRQMLRARHVRLPPTRIKKTKPLGG